MNFNLLKCCLCTKRVDRKSDEKTRKHFHWKSNADEKRTLFTILRNKNISLSPTILNPNALLWSKCARLLCTVKRQERELAESVGQVCGYLELSHSSQAGNTDHESHSVAASRKRSLPDVSYADQEEEVDSVNVHEDRRN